MDNMPSGHSVPGLFARKVIMHKPWMVDLKVAASFVRSIETEDHELNFELGLLADRIDVLIVDIRPSRAPPRSRNGVIEEADKT